MTRFVVAAAGKEAEVQMSEDGAKAVISVQGKSVETRGDRAGGAVWKGFGATGLRSNGINLFTLREAGADGKIICAVPAVMEGARVVWNVLFRADRNASCFKSLGSCQRIGDALDVAFAQLASELKMPHKP